MPVHPVPLISLNRSVSVMLEILDETRTLIKNGLKRGFSFKYKPDATFVTDVDVRVEKHIRKQLKKAYPSHTIYGEELSLENHHSDFMWVIDPIDGTNSFKNRIPLYGTMICLCFQGNPVAGAIDIPEINRRYYGALGMGTRLNGKKILLKDVDPGTSLETQILAVGERIQFINAGKVRFFDHLMESHPHVRTYCDCFGHTLAISGYVGAMADFNLRLWDFLATKILIEEAGGKFTFLNISKPLLMDQKYDILFGKPTIVDWIIQTCVNPSTKRPSKTKNTP